MANEIITKVVKEAGVAVATEYLIKGMIIGGIVGIGTSIAGYTIGLKIGEKLDQQKTN